MSSSSSPPPTRRRCRPTIRSRTQHLEFRLLGADVLDGLLHDVNQAAGLALDDDALSIAVRRGRGSARDALSFLDQVAASGSADDARPEVDELVDVLEAEDAGRALVAVAALHEAGWDRRSWPRSSSTSSARRSWPPWPPSWATPAVTSKRSWPTELAVSACRGSSGASRCSAGSRSTCATRPDPRVVLEVALVRLARPELDDSAAALEDRLARLERAVAGGTPVNGQSAPAPPAPLTRPRSAPAAADPATPPPTPQSAGDPSTRPGLGGAPTPASSPGHPTDDSRRGSPCRHS